MATDGTNIEWAKNRDGTKGKTWNPARGCEMVDEGCRNCYAMVFAANRQSGPGRPFHGYARRSAGGKPQWTGKVDPLPKELARPLGWRKVGLRCFTNSMTDLFHASMPFPFIAAVVGVMSATPKVEYIMLTKRAHLLQPFFKWLRAEALARGETDEQAGRRFAVEALHAAGLARSALKVSNRPLNGWPLKNWILGVSVDSQPAAEERIPHLIHPSVQVAFKAVSYEPALGPVDFDLGRCDHHSRDEVQTRESGEEFCNECAADGRTGELSFNHWLDPLNGGISWVIIGGESGNGARPFNVQWARDLIAQCREAGVAVFVKQLGARPFSNLPVDADGVSTNEVALLRDKKGGKVAEWPQDIRVREWPEPEDVAA